MKLCEITKYDKVNRNIDDAELKSLLHGDYSQAFKALKNNKILYRGASYVGPYVVTDAFKLKRQSANLYSNYYMSLFSGKLPSWKSFPKRSNSIICTTCREDAKEYVHDSSKVIYTVLPKNDALIGVANVRDFWEATRKGLIKVAHAKVFSKFAKDHGYLYEQPSYLGALNVFEHEIAEALHDSGCTFQQFLDYKLDGVKISATFNKFLDPIENGLEKCTIESLPTKKTECWFSSQALLFEANDIDYILQLQK